MASHDARPAWVLPVGVFVAYLGLAQGPALLTSWVLGEEFVGPVFWPAAGLALGLMLITERSRWPVILAAVFVAEVASNLIYGVTSIAMFGWAVANVLHPLVAASLIRRFHPSFDLRSPPQLAALVVFAGVVGPVFSAAVGTAVSVWGWNGTWAGAVGWLVGDGLGALVIAPLFVAVRAPGMPRSSVEVTIGGTTLALVSLLVFRNWDLPVDTVLPYLVLPPLVWAAFRLGLRGAAFGVAAVGMLGGWSTSIGYGPFAAASAAGATVLFQVYLAVLAVTALLIAVLVAGLTEREETQRATECRQRQQAALAELGHRVLVAEQAEDVLHRLDVALRTIDRRPEEPSPDRPDDRRDDRSGTGGRHAGPGSPEASGGDGPTDPWAPLARHRALLDQRSFVEAHPIGAGSTVLATSAATLASNALDRLEQEARLRERADELESLNAQLARAGTFREQLVSMVSHELRSPLTPILGFADVLRRTIPGEPSEPHIALEAIERNARRILELIDELLLSARTADGEHEVRPVVLEVAPSVRRTLEYGFDHVEVVVDDAEPVWALVDPGHLAQCVLNLVTNATKYGGPPVVVQVRNDGIAHVVIEVIDQGEGVPAEIVPVLFDRFTRADRPTDDLSQGVGLGLSIVRSLADANDGTVSYRPPDGDAPTSFVLRFPRGRHGGDPRRPSS